MSKTTISNDQGDYFPPVVTVPLTLSRPTLRALMAGQVATGMLAQGGYGNWSALAKDAVDVTDALMAELERTAQ